MLGEPVPLARNEALLHFAVVSFEEVVLPCRGAVYEYVRIHMPVLHHCLIPLQQRALISTDRRSDCSCPCASSNLLVSIDTQHVPYLASLAQETAELSETTRVLTKKAK